MIASVRGEVMVRRPDHVVLEAGGVGYRLAVSAETLKGVPSRGKEAMLHAHLVVRDDSMSLYGFASEEERDLFLHLTSVSGIGPKVAIAILSGGAPRELLRAIAAGDAKRFQAAPGVGKRTATVAVLSDTGLPVHDIDLEPGGRTPKVIFCSAETDLERIREALDAGAAEYIIKPFDGDIVADKLALAGMA